MKTINYQDLDFFLLQMQAASSRRLQGLKKEEEWRSIYGFKVWIPESFSLADKEVIEELFWSENAPEVLFVTEQRTAGVTMQSIEQEIQSVKEIKDYLSKLDNRIVCYDIGETEDNVTVHWIEYKSFAGDERVYNLLFFFQIGNKNIMGTFYCLFEEYDVWKPFVWDMMQSIKENTDERI